MSIVLGLDLGTNSIGWALRNTVLDENQIEKFGVLTFNKGVGLDKSGEYSYAAKRTQKRSARRLYQARKYRLWATLEVLIQEGFCPLSIDGLNKWRKYSKEDAIKNHTSGRSYPVDDILFDQWVKLDFNGDGKPDFTSPYQLRKYLAVEKLDFNIEVNRFLLGRALYHIAQRRGFKSSRKSSDDVKERDTLNDDLMDLQVSEKKKNSKILELQNLYPQAQTVGWLMAELENNRIRVRSDISQHIIRENYKDEIKYIFEFQELGLEHVLFKRTVESFKNRNDGSIFYRRPLRSQKGTIGKCTLEPTKYRVPISHPDFEQFRAWAFLNNIKYRSSSQDETWKPLPLELKQELFRTKFLRKSKPYFPFSEIEEIVSKKNKGWFLNYPSKTTVSGCPVSARLIEIFGDNLAEVKIKKAVPDSNTKAYYDLSDIWHVLFSFEDQDLVSDFARVKIGLDEENIKRFLMLWNSMPVGYGMLSLNAIRKINFFLLKGMIYTEAVLMANIPVVLRAELWKSKGTFIENSIAGIIGENRIQKRILAIVNSLISSYRNPDQKFGYRNKEYQLDASDLNDIRRGIEEEFGKNGFDSLEKEKQERISNDVLVCYQEFFSCKGQVQRDTKGERYFEVVSGKTVYIKTDSGYYRLPKLLDTLKAFLSSEFGLEEDSMKKLYHPSEISIYPPAKSDSKGVVKLGSPKTGSFKNPMAMRTLHELRKLVNYFIETQQVDSDTRVVVEVARELNDANKRWAINAWQRQREQENQEFAFAISELMLRDGVHADPQSDDDIDKVRLWYEQNDEEAVPPISESKREVKGIRWSELKKESYKKIVSQKAIIDKYRLWKEQECRCIYTGKIIKITDLFDSNLIDFEHTIPRSLSFDDSLANLTVCYADYNRTVKKQRIPFQLPDYDMILQRIQKWEEKVIRINQQIDFWSNKARRASDKQWKDDAIRQRHLWQMELDYWSNKVGRFRMKEVTSGFKNSQKVDTQLISKYALHYLKTFFDKVDVQKGSITASFRKIYGLVDPNSKKDRSTHSHHAVDAAVLTLIPVAARRDEILESYYKSKEQNLPFTASPYAKFRREFIWGINDDVLINNSPNRKYLVPSKRNIRKRGKKQYIPGTNRPLVAQGDSIRGQLHQETFYGAIKPPKKDDNGASIKDGDGKFVPGEKIKYVLRVPLVYKKDAASPGFKTLDDIQRLVVDEGLKQQIAIQVAKAGGLKEALDEGVYLLDKNGRPHGNKIRHIRTWASVSEPLVIKKQTNLSKHDYKQFYYSANATNCYFAIYEADGQKECELKNLYETAQVVSSEGVRRPVDLFAAQLEVKKAKKDLILPLKYILENDTKVIFLKERFEDIRELPKNELLKRLYVYSSYEKDGRLNFRYHKEARTSIPEKYQESEVDFLQPKPTLRFGFRKYDFLVEGYDFNVTMDGSIEWI